jgi:hypothetical protein
MSPFFRPWLHLAALGFALAAGACSKPDAGEKQPGQAFLDSQIPSGLSPQYFPPQGFVWGGYRSGSLPEARYGVASPPVNPRAQVLILADADYPAETYFELANQLLDEGYGVWLLEVPGQGGAGQYSGQKQAVFTRSYRDGQMAAIGFIRDIIHPTPEKPLFIVGTGYSALNALSLSTTAKDKTLAGFIAYAPYLGQDIEPGVEWHSTDITAGYWDSIAHAWRGSNPDLRIRVKSDPWRTQMHKSWSDLNSLHLPVISLTAPAAPVVVIAPKNAPQSQSGTLTALCARLSRCRVETTSGPDTLGENVASFIRDVRPTVK